MTTIRIARLWMKPRLRDILIDAIAREPDMELLPHGFAAAGAAPADAVVLVREVSDPLNPELPDQLLDVGSRVRLLLIAEPGAGRAL